MEFRGEHGTYYLKREHHEPYCQFYDRGWTLAKLNPNTQEKLEKDLQTAKLIAMKNRLGCQYPKEIEEKLQSLQHQLKR